MSTKPKSHIRAKQITAQHHDNLFLSAQFEYINHIISVIIIALADLLLGKQFICKSIFWFPRHHKSTNDQRSNSPPLGYDADDWCFIRKTNKHKYIYTCQAIYAKHSSNNNNNNNGNKNHSNSNKISCSSVWLAMGVIIITIHIYSYLYIYKVFLIHRLFAVQAELSQVSFFLCGLSSFPSYSRGEVGGRSRQPPPHQHFFVVFRKHSPNHWLTSLTPHTAPHHIQRVAACWLLVTRFGTARWAWESRWAKRWRDCGRLNRIIRLFEQSKEDRAVESYKCGKSMSDDLEKGVRGNWL